MIKDRTGDVILSFILLFRRLECLQVTFSKSYIQNNDVSFLVTVSHVSELAVNLIKNEV